ncbi:serine hydrolase domain-containing protein [Psychroserpens luteolus]|uniref:serine hydrolase domain-containing protein n=1 Tax=Psychroserpens luteolus TaxID=2855840 RepID=UPI001E2AD44A|nr:serine hydrolase domain-containing protein [Psychroserpens luteolus]MCD2259183.1 beta-lactamase family protein [Psychroserpens luteolus]
MMLIIKKLALIILLLSSGCFAQESNFSQLDEFFNILEENNKLMATMTISKNNQEIYNKAVGFSEVATKIKNSANTKFRIGSITKAFTAVMVFQLIDEGKITLETPLSMFYPKVLGSEKIKISNLLNHSSGLYNITNDPDFGEWMLNPSTKGQMLSRIKKYTLDFEPGEKTEYSNTNYLLLGYIIEDLDKDMYSQCLDRRIVKKIGLEHTYYGGEINIKANESNSYEIENKEWTIQPETNMSNPGGAGAIVSISGDLTKFMDALFNGDLISKSSLEAMKKSNNKEVCHGLFYANMNGVDLYASEGGIDGFQSMLVHVPLTKTTIALVSNGLDFSKMRIMLAAFASSHGQPITLPNFTHIDLTEEQVKLYVGEYACDDVPYKLIFKAKGNILLGAPEQSNLKELTPTKQHQFTFDSLGVVLDFYPDTGLVRFTRGDNKPLLFKKL